MIEELRIYRIRAGGLNDYLRHAKEIQVPIRGDRHGKLLGFWHGEIGVSHSVFNLWRHKGLDHRQELRAGLDGNEAWKTEYLPRVWPLMEEQEIRIIDPVMPFEARGRDNFYEVRLIRTKVGEARSLAAALMTDAPAPFRDATAGLGLTMMGRLNEVVHIAAYNDASSRLDASLAHSDWLTFFQQHGSKIAEMTSSLLLPAPHSPAR